MWQDPIIEEIHQTRQQIAEAFGNDMHAICEAARRGELHKAFIRPIDPTTPQAILPSNHPTGDQP
jgi:hypothetical protein